MAFHFSFSGLLLLLLLFICPSSVPALASSPPPSSSSSPPSWPSVHTFFYLWYGNPATDGRYIHWNHTVLPHWTEAVNKRYGITPSSSFSDPERDPGTSFFPSRGLYSSSSPSTLLSQLREMRAHGIDVAVLCWHGEEEGRGDGQGAHTDRSVPLVLAAAAQVKGLSIAFLLEPYGGRDAEGVRRDITYIMERYGDHPALFREEGTGKALFYVYDSYHIKEEEWRGILSRPSSPPSASSSPLPSSSADANSPGSLSLRSSPSTDALFIALVVSPSHIAEAQRGGFDGIFTYFSSNSFSFGSSPSNWGNIAREAKERGLLFFPSLGPGYNDMRIRPWNGENKKERRGGAYYDDYWERALALVRGGDGPIKAIGITSYNEWGEGTQIEPARAFTTDKGEKLSDYSDTEGRDAGWQPEEGKEGENKEYIEEIKEKGWGKEEMWYMRRTAYWSKKYKEAYREKEEEERRMKRETGAEKEEQRESARNEL